MVPWAFTFTVLVVYSLTGYRYLVGTCAVDGDLYGEIEMGISAGKCNLR